MSLNPGSERGVAKRCVGRSPPDRRQGALPGFIEPAGDRWIHEIQFDGYRVQLHIANEGVKVFTRRGNDWTKRFRKVADDAFLISAGSAIIDGEVVVPAADGTTDFSVLQNELKGKSRKIVMVAFDLLYLNGYDLRKLPLRERKAHLKKLIGKTAIQLSESFEVDGAEMFKRACATGLEGVVSTPKRVRQKWQSPMSGFLRRACRLRNERKAPIIIHISNVTAFSAEGALSNWRMKSPIKLGTKKSLRRPDAASPRRMRIWP
jgi:ATP dependent DNA ligase domain